MNPIKNDEPNWLTGIGILLLLCLIAFGSYSCISDEIEIRKCRELLVNLQVNQVAAIHIFASARLWERGEKITSVSDQDSLEKFIEALNNLRTANDKKPAIKTEYNISIVTQEGEEIELDIGMATTPNDIARFTILKRGTLQREGYLVGNCGSFESADLFQWLSLATKTKS